MSVVASLSCVSNIAKHQPMETCDVHHVPLATSVVPLVYGLPPVLSNAYREASAAQFPNSFLYANGGCVVHSLVRKAKVRACPQCNAAEKEWLKAHKKYRYEEEKAAQAQTEHSSVQPTD